MTDERQRPMRTILSKQISGFASEANFPAYLSLEKQGVQQKVGGVVYSSLKCVKRYIRIIFKDEDPCAWKFAGKIGIIA